MKPDLQENVIIKNTDILLKLYQNAEFFLFSWECIPFSTQL